MHIAFFHTDVENFIRGLQARTIAKVLRTFELLEKFSHRLGMPHSKSIGTQMFELRVRGTQEVRFIYIFAGPKIIILHGFVKKSKEIPRKEIALALARKSLFDRI